MGFPHLDTAEEKKRKEKHALQNQGGTRQPALYKKPASIPIIPFRVSLSYPQRYNQNRALQFHETAPLAEALFAKAR
jgi:nitrate reductase cytochrome c-type subunit